MTYGAETIHSGAGKFNGLKYVKIKGNWAVSFDKELPSYCGVAEMISALEEIQEIALNESELSVDIDDYYGSSFSVVRNIKRPATEEEVAAIEKWEDRESARKSRENAKAKAAKEANERRQYEKLRKKFGDG